ncbi:MAG: prephenate dehydrogenase/arogenate dehydrogenase family protein, partial [Gammaproteobacteria bacterium]
MAPAHPAVPTNPGTIGGHEGALAYGHRFPIRRLTVIGVGLIGGSLARALRRARLVEEVVGCGRSLDNLQRAVQLGVIDRYSQDPAAAVAGADLVFLAVPLGAMAATFAAIRDHLAPGAILTDGG